ncbi:MAG: hypothetical protein DMF91_23580 [Acidobacteria bacterium]|nr:MAG: hypothetical protein DMF91_23580 [Acidobacteriota bacterium]
MDKGQVGRVGQVGQVSSDPAHQTYPAYPTHQTAWEFLAVLAGAAILTVALTYPLAFRPGNIGRIDTGDGQFSIWNVAWVARTLVVDPRHVFDANIFYPHRGTLAYSEANLGAGVLAMPAYWATRNPYAAHNSAVLIAFVLSAIGAFSLVRYLTADRRAAAVSAICYAFCPQVFSRTAEIQLLMTFGLPLTMLAFHRMADRPSTGRALALGVAMALTTYFCAYYGVFVLLMVGFASLVVPALRRRWRNGEYWVAVAIAAATAVVLILPLFEPYLALKQVRGFSRSLRDARQYAADWRSYITSSAHAHLWIADMVGKGKAVAFPGLIAVGFGVAGIQWGPRSDARARDGHLVRNARRARALGLVRTRRWAVHGAVPRGPGVHTDACTGAVWARRRLVSLDSGRLRRPVAARARPARDAGRRDDRGRRRRGAGRSAPLEGGAADVSRVPHAADASARAGDRDAVFLAGGGPLPAHRIHAQLDVALDAARQRLQ